MYLNPTTFKLKRSIEQAYESELPPYGPGRELPPCPSAHGASGSEIDMAFDDATPMDIDVPQTEEKHTRSINPGGEAATAQGPIDVTFQVAPRDVKKIHIDGRFVAVREMWSTTCNWPSGSREGDNTFQPARSHGTVNEPHSKTGKTALESDLIDVAMDASVDHDSSIPPRPSHFHRRGWGPHPDEEVFHTVPSSYNKHNKKRVVFRPWPRKSDARPLEDDVVRPGTLSPDGYPWGATLYDFFNVVRFLDDPNHRSIMTGSQLCQTMDALGESKAAILEVEWAKSEAQPRVEGVADTEELIRNVEKKLCALPHGTFGRNEAPQDVYVPPPSIPVTSPSHPSHYPKPWPFTPFENDLPILLQERIPLYLLPQTLYVHDPFDLLAVDTERFRDTTWMSRPDIVRTYNLQLSEHMRTENEDARKKAEELATIKSRTLVILRYRRTKEQVDNHEPIIEVSLPPYPPRPTHIEEAHLYISPVAKVGEGYHSIVYKGEWELPREIFMKPRICPLCFKRHVDEEIRRLKETGSWDKTLGEASWTRGPIVFGRRDLATQVEQDEVTNLTKNGETIERELTSIVSPDADPSQIMEWIDETDTWDEFMKNPDVNRAMLWFGDARDDMSMQMQGSHVPIIRIHPSFSHETCTHGTHDSPVLRTVKFTVVAKLSVYGYSHLSTEASNYQQFPKHFFQNYNGYTFMRKLHSIVPVNAIVPQFYGYYTPQEDQGSNSGSTKPRYLSPILLQEHCGKPIHPNELPTEDKEECKSLLLRFQRAGWLHGSILPRHIVVQRGKPTEFPHVRERKPEPSFRLINFGRSRKYADSKERREEEMRVEAMFRPAYLSWRPSPEVFLKVADGEFYWGT